MPLFFTLATWGFLNSFDSCHVTDWRQPVGRLCLHNLLDFHGWWALALQALAPGGRAGIPTLLLTIFPSWGQLPIIGFSFVGDDACALAMTPLCLLAA